MKPYAEFDGAFDTVETELVELEKIALSLLPLSHSKNLARWHSIRQERSRLSQMAQHARRLEDLDQVKGDTLRALLFWIREFTDRLQSYNRQYVSYIDKLLWLNLVRLRSGPKKPNFDISIKPQDFALMIQHKLDLEKEELQLKRELENLHQTYSQVEQSSQFFPFEEATRMAAKSFGAPLRSINASKQPTLNAFSKLLTHFQLQRHSDGQKVKLRRNATEELEFRSQELLQACSKLLRQGTSESRSDTLSDKIKEIERLEHEISVTLGILSAPKEPRQASLIVKKVSNRARNERQSQTE